jgi:hypothetical protein
LSKAAEEKAIIIIPGGGVFADTIRRIDKIYRLSPETAHWMATLSLDQYGLLLAELIPKAKTSTRLEEALNLAVQHVPTVFLPYQLFKLENPLEASWNVTSDSISAYFAWKFKAEKLILLKDVDGIFLPPYRKNRKGKLLKKIVTTKLKSLGETCVDLKLAWLLEKFNLKCFVASGLKPTRLFRVLEGKSTVGTEIKVKDSDCG